MEPSVEVIPGINTANSASVVDVANSGNQASVVSVSNPLASSASSVVVEKFELSTTDVNLKQVQLNKAPTNPSSVVVFPQGGIPQFSGIDFVVTDNILSWNNLGLDGFLQQGETIFVQY